MKTRLYRALAVSLFFTAILLNACSQQSSAKGGAEKSTAENTAASADVISVSVASVLVREAAATVHAIGILSTKEEVKLSFKIGGVIESISVRDGESVRTGQVLARLNRSEINAQVAQAQQGADKAKRDMERVQALYNEKALTLEQLQNATTGYEVASENLRIAKFNQQYASIVASTSGKVLKVVSKAGELTAPGAPVVVVSSETSGWVVRVGLSDRDVVRLRVGDKARVRFDAFPNVEFAATVRDLAAAASQQTGTFEAELAIQPNGKKFVTGFVANVDITPSASDTVMFVPIESIVEGNGLNASVYALSGDRKTARKLPVQIAFLQYKYVAIKSGLQGVQEVVTSGAEYLADGVSVRVVGK